MPRWIVPLLIASAIIFILEYYAFQAVKTVTKNRIVRWVWMTIGIVVYLNLLYVTYVFFIFCVGFLSDTKIMNSPKLRFII